jgi:uncharacterized membrane protein
MQLYRERPKSIEAIQWDGTEECAIKISGDEDFTGHINYNGKNFNSFFLTTNNGDLKLTPGDYVIKDWYGEYTLMPEKIFNRMYKVFE